MEIIDTHFFKKKRPGTGCCQTWLHLCYWSNLFSMPTLKMSMAGCWHLASTMIATWKSVEISKVRQRWTERCFWQEANKLIGCCLLPCTKPFNHTCQIWCHRCDLFIVNNLRPCLILKKNSTVPVTSNFRTHAGTLNVVEKIINYTV